MNDALSRVTLLSLEPRARGPISEYDEIRRGLLRYDQVVRRSSERVERFCEQVRRRHAAEEEAARFLPAAALRLSGSARGITGGRIVVRNQRGASGMLTVRALRFRAFGRDEQAEPSARTRPSAILLPAGAERPVTFQLDLTDTSFRAGDSISGDVEVLIDGELAATLAVDVALYSDRV